MTLSTRTLGVLQWAGLLGGGLVAGLQWLMGYWTTEAQCKGPGSTGAIANDVWIGTMAGIAGVLVVVALAASVVVFMRTRSADPGDGPLEEQPLPLEPYGRLHFFSAAAMAANVIFLGIIALSTLGATVNVVCRQS